MAGGERAKGTGEERKGEGGFSGVRAKEFTQGHTEQEQSRAPKPKDVAPEGSGGLEAVVES